MTESSQSWFKRFKNQLNKTGDGEPNQTMIRLSIGLILIIYFCLPWAENETFIQAISSLPSLILIFFYTSSLVILFAILKNPVPSPSRRVAGILLDMTCLSLVMYLSGGESVVVFVMYLWVTIGNGFRFGVKYLYFSQGIGLLGFTIAIFTGEFWKLHIPFAISLLIMLIALPLYVSVLLKKLHSAIDDAKQANKAKSQFLANMSHELRTPLNGVIGMGDLLCETRLNSEQRGLVDTLQSSATTLLELIENVLDISKIEAGKVIIKNKPFDLHALVNSVIYMLAPMGDSKKLLVSCHIEPETPFSLSGDQPHIRQILINLISNAIKFTDEGTVMLNVYTTKRIDRKVLIKFEIIDSGIGISEENIATIFENFTQADTTSSRSFGGTGLGTTISRELVELMDGKIGVESEINNGSKFWFELPLTVMPQNKNDIAENRLILLASEKAAAEFRSSLKNWKVDYDWVRSSARALSLLVQAAEQGSRYESIIVDQDSLSDVNAVQFAQMIRAEEILKNTSLILINSSASMIDANSVNKYYISTIQAPEQTRFLFNAIHAAKSIHPGDTNVIALSEHYKNQSNAKTLNILVAEDNKVNQQVIEGILKHAGHSVFICDSGEKTLDILCDQMEKIDLMILDMNMPEKSGLEVVKSLRFMDTEHSLPVIMLTADATPRAREDCLRAGADVYLTKPVDARKLLERIAVLSKHVSSSKIDIRSPQAGTRKLKTKLSESPWLDETVLLELSTLSDDTNFIQSLVLGFEQDGSKHILGIQNSLNDDYLQYRESLHALKGSATELGAKKLADICAKAETLKPYDIGTDKIVYLQSAVEDAFYHTVSALQSAVGFNKDQQQPKRD